MKCRSAFVSISYRTLLSIFSPIHNQLKENSVLDLCRGSDGGLRNLLLKSRQVTALYNLYQSSLGGSQPKGSILESQDPQQVEEHSWLYSLMWWLASLWLYGDDMTDLLLNDPHIFFLQKKPKASLPNTFIIFNLSICHPGPCMNTSFCLDPPALEKLAPKGIKEPQ